MVEAVSGNVITKMSRHIEVREERNGIVLSMQVQDRAGKRSEEAQLVFSVDRTRPAVRIEMDNNDVSNDRFFHRERTASVTVTEKNFDPARVRIHADGAQISDWVSLGEVHTAVVRFCEEGDYTFSVQAEDRAGNAAQEAETQGKAVSRFTVDTVFETFEISGVEEGASYRADIRPEIVLRDRHFDSCEIQVLQTTRERAGADVTDRIFAETDQNEKGLSAKGLISAGSPGMDGLYTVKVSARDLAGNQLQKTVRFTVNRFGSIYVYDDYLQELRGKYIRSVEQPLIITEYNPVPLLRLGTLEVTQDGMPLQTPRLRQSSQKLTTGKKGAGGWHAYQYQILPETFRGDGVYRVSVSGEDQSGNLLESANQDAGEIWFCVDQTPPSLDSVYVVPDAEREDMLRVQVKAFDALGLTRLRILLDGRTILDKQTFADPVQETAEFRISGRETGTLWVIMTDRAGNLTEERRSLQELMSAMPYAGLTEENQEPEETSVFLQEDHQEGMQAGTGEKEKEQEAPYYQRIRSAENDRETDRKFGILCLMAFLTAGGGLVRMRILRGTNPADPADAEKQSRVFLDK